MRPAAAVEQLELAPEALEIAAARLAFAPAQVAPADAVAPAVQPAAQLRIEIDPVQPDWRFAVLAGDRVIAEAYFDADRGWERADRPRGWTLRFTPSGPWEDRLAEVPIAPEGRALRWAWRDQAAAEALRLARQRQVSLQ
jgi:hypothetical protein